MNYRKTIILTAITCLYTSAHAAIPGDNYLSVGVGGDIANNMHFVLRDGEKHLVSNIDIRNKAGISINVSGSHFVNRYLGMETGFSYAKNDFHTNNDIFFQDTTNTKSEESSSSDSSTGSTASDAAVSKLVNTIQQQLNLFPNANSSSTTSTKNTSGTGVEPMFPISHAKDILGQTSISRGYIGVIAEFENRSNFIPFIHANAGITKLSIAYAEKVSMSYGGGMGVAINLNGTSFANITYNISVAKKPAIAFQVQPPTTTKTTQSTTTGGTSGSTGGTGSGSTGGTGSGGTITKLSINPPQVMVHDQPKPVTLNVKNPPSDPSLLNPSPTPSVATAGQISKTKDTNIAYEYAKYVDVATTATPDAGSSTDTQDAQSAMANRKFLGQGMHRSITNTITLSIKFLI